MRRPSFQILKIVRDMDLLLVGQPGFCFDSPCNILKTKLNVSGVSLFGKFPSLTGVSLDFSKLMSFEVMFSSSRVLTVARTML